MSSAFSATPSAASSANFSHDPPPTPLNNHTRSRCIIQMITSGLLGLHYPRLASPPASPWPAMAASSPSAAMMPIRTTPLRPKVLTLPSITVADAPLTATGTTITAVQGTPFTGVVASFTDADPNGVAGDYSASIYWGDGQTSTGTVTANGSGGFNCHPHQHVCAEGRTPSPSRSRTLAGHQLLPPPPQTSRRPGQRYCPGHRR